MLDHDPIALALGGAAACVASMPATSAACEPAQIETSTGDLPDAWRAALEDLVRATGREGQAWSCTGARVSLSLDPEHGGAILRVEERDGRVTLRHVTSPDDLVATGEALLALPGVRRDPPAPPAVTADAPAVRRSAIGEGGRTPVARTSPPAPSPRHEPRLYAGGALGTRYDAPTQVLWGGATLRATVPFGAWSAGLWARADLPAVMFDEAPHHFSMSEACLGLALGRRLETSLAELEASLDPSLALVSMEGGQRGDFAEGGKFDVRVGLSLRGARTIDALWRATVALDGELSPAGIDGSEGRRIDPRLPPIPAFSAGLALGVEVAFP